MLLLKLAAEADKHITLEDQEKDVTTARLARMNMILHDFPTASSLTNYWRAKRVTAFQYPIPMSEYPFSLLFQLHA